MKVLRQAVDLLRQVGKILLNGRDLLRLLANLLRHSDTAESRCFTALSSEFTAIGSGFTAP